MVEHQDKLAFKAALMYKKQWTTREEAASLYSELRPMFDCSITFRTFCAMSGAVDLQLNADAVKGYLKMRSEVEP